MSGSIEEGSVGSGTGVTAFRYKAGSGTASRIVTHYGLDLTVGVSIRASFGDRRALTIRGHRVVRDLPEPSPRTGPREAAGSSTIGIVATDAPLLPHQLARLARRAALGMGRTGGMANHTSGDLFLAFSTANEGALQGTAAGFADLRIVPDSAELNAFFAATIDATEEAILNSLVANTDMTGRDGNVIPAMPLDRIRSAFSS